MAAVQQCCAALKALHDPYTDPAVQIKANQFLTEFQTTLPAWTAADQILKNPQLSNEAHFYAANLLRTKLQFHFEELPEGQRIPFRNSLLSTVVRFKAGRQTVKTRLALCVGALFVQTAGSESWPNALPEMTQAFKTPDQALTLLDILTVVPEECREDQIDVPHAQRIRAVEQCKKFAVQAVSILTSFLRSAGNKRDLQKKVLECFAAWIKMDMVDPSHICREPLFQYSFNALEVPELFEVACEVLAQTFRSTDDFRRYTEFVTTLVPKVLALRTLFQQRVEAKDNLACRQLGNVFIEMGESYLHFVLEFSPTAAQTMNLILTITAHPDKDISSNTFNFWYRLAKAVKTLAQENPQKAVECRNKLAPYFAQVLLHLHGVMKYPTDYETWDQDSKDKSKRYREEAGDILRDCASIMGAERCLKDIFQVLQREARVLQDRWPTAWQGTEASLYCVRMIARQVLDVKPPEQLILPQIMRLIPQFGRHEQLQYTSTLIVGRYAEWLKGFPVLLSPLFPFVIQGFSKPEIVNSSCRAFIFICESCAEILAKTQLETLFKLYKQSSALGNKSQLQLIEGFCNVLSILPIDKYIQALRECLQPIMTEMKAYMQSSNPPSQKVEECLDRLAEFFRCLGPSRSPEPAKSFAALKQLAEVLLPLLLKLLEKFSTDNDIVEALIRVFKYAIRTMKGHFLSLLPPLFTTLVPHYESKPHSSFLYLLHICCEEYGGEQVNAKVCNVLLEILGKFSNRTVRILDTAQTINQNPDFVEDYFSLMERFLKVMPDYVLAGARGQVISEAWQCALRSLKEQHYQASKSVMCFLHVLLGLAVVKKESQGVVVRPKDLHVQVVARLLQQNGEHVAQALMQGLMGDLPKSHNEYVIKAILTLNRVASAPPLDCRTWVAQTVIKANPQISEQKKQRFLRTFCTADQDPRALEDALWEFSQACRKKSHASKKL
eukprot:gb/GEZN01001563.1/.p1 GENE.gb/GEZN01001563.1/~~gb/GEZN01001563.1/.p1  ORF type:complete len:950 (+),score=163.27 gb/GEZN01001563.1/:108-2957(+)